MRYIFDQEVVSQIISQLHANFMLNDSELKLIENIGICTEIPLQIAQLFNLKINVKLLLVNVRNISKCLEIYREKLIKRAHPLLNNVYNLEQLQKCGIQLEETPAVQQNQKLILLNNDVEFPQNSCKPCIYDSVHQIHVVIPYKFQSRQQLLRHVLSQDEVPMSFEQCGHIAIYNTFTEVQYKYRHFIGAATLSHAVTSVALKTEALNNEFRTPTLELIAGCSSYETQVTQFGFGYKLNVETVYWNSKLETEHFRLINQVAQIFGKSLQQQRNVKTSIQPNDQQIKSDIFNNEIVLSTDQYFILDGTCGVGPFSIPLGSCGITVLGNDLNKTSCDYLEQNIVINNVQKHVSVLNEDCTLVLKHLLQERNRFKLFSNDAPKKLGVVILNLPELSIEFLNVYKNLNVETTLQLKDSDQNIQQATKKLVVRYTSFPQFLKQAAIQVQSPTEQIIVSPYYFIETFTRCFQYYNEEMLLRVGLTRLELQMFKYLKVHNKDQECSLQQIEILVREVEKQDGFGCNRFTDSFLSKHKKTIVLLQCIFKKFIAQIIRDVSTCKYMVHIMLLFNEDIISQIQQQYLNDSLKKDRK